MHALITRVIAIAQAALAAHVHEIGYTNTGREVNAYLADVGLPPGLAWCAAFMCWCLDTAGAALGYRIPYRSGSCPDIEAWARRQRILHETGPQVGDWGLLQMWDAGGQYSGHIGLVIAVHGDGTISTIEGNTSAGDGGSQTDGGGVHQRVRNASDWYFVRWIDVVAPVAPMRLQLVDAAGGTRAVDCRPALEDGRLCVDVRGLADAAGATITVASGGEYTVRARGASVTLTVGVDSAIVDGRLRAPVRSLAERLGYQVDATQLGTAGIVRLRRAA